MTDKLPPQGDVDGFDPILATDALLATTAEALRNLLEQVQRGDFGKAGDLAREQAQLRRALGSSLYERRKIDEVRCESGADAYHAPLDLAAARDEIGRRLACLREAGGAGSVSGEPE